MAGSINLLANSFAKSGLFNQQPIFNQQQSNSHFAHLEILKRAAERGISLPSISIVHLAPQKKQDALTSQESAAPVSRISR